MVSIIVPVYNVGRFIRECINSLINQTVQDIEIILVDDGSTDSSGIVCDEYKEADSRIIVVHKDNGGLNSAIKKGLEIAAGKQVAFVDSDDWVELNYIEVMLDAMVSSDCDLVCANGYSNSNDEIVKKFHNCVNKVYEEGEIRKSIFPGLFSCVDSIGYRITPSRCAKFFLREKLIENIRYYKQDVQLGEDSLLTYPYILRCKKITFIEDSIYHYRVNYNSISNQFRKENFDDLLECIHQYELMAKELSELDFSKQIMSRRVEVVYRTLHEIIENTHAENRKKMFNFFEEVGRAFDSYPVLPYSANMRTTIQYKMIQQKKISELWVLMNAWQKIKTRKNSRRQT